MPEPNAQKHSQTCSSAYLGRLHAFVAKKSTRVSLPGKCIRVLKCTRFASFFVPEPNAQKHSQTCSIVYFPTRRAFDLKKSTRVSLPGNSAFGCRNAPVLHHFSCRNRMPKNTPKPVLVYI